MAQAEQEDSGGLKSKTVTAPTNVRPADSGGSAFPVVVERGFSRVADSAVTFGRMQVNQTAPGGRIVDHNNAIGSESFWVVHLGRYVPGHGPSPC